MILTHKAFLKIIGVDILVFGALLGALTCRIPDARLWVVSVFYDKLYVYLLSPLFLTGAAMIDGSLRTCAVTRLGSRDAFLSVWLLQQYLYAFLYLAIWHLLVLVYASVFYADAGLTFSGLADWFLRFLWGLLMLVHVAGFVKVGSRRLSASCYVVSYGVMLTELMIVVPESNRSLPRTIRLLFAWIFHTGDSRGISWAIRILWLLASGVCMYIGNRRKDWLET